MQLEPLINAINDQSIVCGLTHDIYRYPARFSPLFPRTAIQLFTKPGETVLDPFMGSSTSLVESLAMGRHAVGTDISSLAIFLARVKTCLLDDEEIDEITKWGINIASKLSPRNRAVRQIEWKDAGYQDNLPWRFRKVIEQALNRAKNLEERIQPVARCIVLKTAQWAVDCKKRLPTIAEFREQMIDYSTTVTSGLKALREQVESLGNTPPTIEAHQCSAEEISALKSNLLRRRPPKLVVTSPPYPAVHVLYNRWQVLGRRETAAPFWIADCRDDQGASFYTFGDRRRQDHDEQYFDRLERSFSEIRKVVRDDCIVVQLVGFARPGEQLRAYMKAMKKAGFDEYSFKKAGHRLRREELWRAVPNRKWYTCLRAETTQTKEILLVHRAG